MERTGQMGDDEEATGSSLKPLPSLPPSLDGGGTVFRGPQRPHTSLNDGCVKFALPPHSHSSGGPFVSQNEKEGP